MFLYIVQKMGGPSWLKQKPGNLASIQPAAWYHTCDQCLLDLFKRCLFQGDLSALIISGNPSIEDLAEAWGNIYAEYLDLNNDNETLYILLLQCEIAKLTNDLVEIDTALRFLSTALLPGMAMAYRPELVDVLKSHEFDYPFNINNREEFQQNIREVDSRLSPLRLRLEMSSKEYADYIASKGDQSIDFNYFDKMLSRIARFRHVSVIRASEITVKEFVLMVQDYLDYYKSKQKATDQDGEEG